MTWEWSHSNEAYENAKANLAELSIEDLRIIYSEWTAYIKACKDEEQNPYDCFNPDNYFDEKEYETVLNVCAPRLYKHQLVEHIWAHVEQLRECDNGGFNAYVCPFHCHTVSFDRDEELTEV